MAMAHEAGLRVTRFEVFRYAVPLRAPLMLKGASLATRDGVLLRLEDAQGAVGWGEAAPLPGFSRETPDEAGKDLLALKSALLDQEIAGHPLDPDGALARRLDARAPAPSARFAVELAAGTLYAAARQTTLPPILSATPRATVTLNGLLMGTPDALPGAARRLRADGYRAAKLKVGRQRVADEVSLVHAVADALGPDIRLRLDANRAWAFDDAARFAEGIRGVAIDYIEEPLADPRQMPSFAARFPALPVALDESVVGLSPEGLTAHAYARALVLKPTFLGGLVPTRRLARQAEALGMTSVLSAAFETGLGLRGLIGLAASLADIPAGLDTYRRLADDLLDPPLVWQGGAIDVAALFGTPRTVKHALLHPFDA